MSSDSWEKRGIAHIVRLAHIDRLNPLLQESWLQECIDQKHEWKWKVTYTRNMTHGEVLIIIKWKTILNFNWRNNKIFIFEKYIISAPTGTAKLWQNYSRAFIMRPSSKAHKKLTTYEWLRGAREAKRNHSNRQGLPLVMSSRSTLSMCISKAIRIINAKYIGEIWKLHKLLQM